MCSNTRWRNDRLDLTSRRWMEIHTLMRNSSSCRTSHNHHYSRRAKKVLPSFLPSFRYFFLSFPQPPAPLTTFLPASMLKLFIFFRFFLFRLPPSLPPTEINVACLRSSACSPLSLVGGRAAKGDAAVCLSVCLSVSLPAWPSLALLRSSFSPFPSFYFYISLHYMHTHM